MIFNSFLLNILGELIGTLILVLLGNGVCYSVSHNKMFANQSGKWILIVIGWGLAVFISVIIANAIGSFANINPAVSVYFAIKNLDASFLLLIPFELIGAMIGQIILDFINWKFVLDTAQTNTIATKSSHCTIPAFNQKNDKSSLFNFSYEFIGTSILLSLILALSILESKNNNVIINGINQSNPIQIMAVVMSIGISLGSATGYAINPARDLGPRIIYFFYQKIIYKKTNIELASVDWSYSWIPVLAPIISGCVIGSLSLLS